MMWGCGPGMMGWGMGWGMPFFGIFWIILIVAGIWAVAQLLRAPDRDRQSSALNILEERYARGEIGRDEYLQKKDDIRSPGGKRA